ncbi:MAG: hypothetical protein KDA27_25835 [Candidatus Eisenbacteria bacterium]|uniref:Uncharacterized protein n=1 Tax=Eiseniibacteriota bacterium TaxID=2212470 RepID=A0A956NIK8_UNCEI|nr:hypothetical protein [Candidatus Eisenbacteria bacterium]
MRRKDPNEVRHALARSSWWFCLLGLGAWSLCDSSPCRGSESPFGSPALDRVESELETIDYQFRPRRSHPFPGQQAPNRADDRRLFGLAERFEALRSALSPNWRTRIDLPVVGSSEISLQVRIRGLDEADLVVRWHAEF